MQSGAFNIPQNRPLEVGIFLSEVLLCRCCSCDEAMCDAYVIYKNVCICSLSPHMLGMRLATCAQRRQPLAWYQGGACAAMITLWSSCHSPGWFCQRSCPKGGEKESCAVGCGCVAAMMVGSVAVFAVGVERREQAYRTPQ